MLVIREIHSSMVLGKKHGLAVILSTAVVDKTSTGHSAELQDVTSVRFVERIPYSCSLNSFTFFNRVQPFCV